MRCHRLAGCSISGVAGAARHRPVREEVPMPAEPRPRTASRRTVLLGTLSTAALATVATLPGSAAAADPVGAQSLIHRSYLHSAGWGIRKVTSQQNGYGMWIHEPGDTTWQFESGFYQLCSQWAEALNGFCASSTSPQFTIDWFGARWTHRGFPAQSEHVDSKAMDLTAIYFTNNEFVDMNISWRAGAGLHQQRRYIAVAALLRVYFLEVLTAGWQNSHFDHIHFDPVHPDSPGISNGERDTLIVQRACNFLNGATLALDGQWGAQTEQAYQNLLGAFDMRCVNPKASYLEMAAFLQMICRHGLRNVAAGHYRYGC